MNDKFPFLAYDNTHPIIRPRLLLITRYNSIWSRQYYVAHDVNFEFEVMYHHPKNDAGHLIINRHHIITLKTLKDV